MNTLPPDGPTVPIQPGRLKSSSWAPPELAPLLDDPDLVEWFATSDFRPRDPVDPIGRILYVHQHGSIVVPIGFRTDGLMDCLLLRGPASSEEVFPLVLIEESYIGRATELGVRLPDDRMFSDTGKGDRPPSSDADLPDIELGDSATGPVDLRTRFKPPPCDRLDWLGFEETVPVEEESESLGEPPSLREPRHKVRFDDDLDDPDAVEMIAAKLHQWPPRDRRETPYGKLLYLHEHGAIVIWTGNVMQFGSLNALVIRGRGSGSSAGVSEAECRLALEVGIYLPDSAKQ